MHCANVVCPQTLETSFLPLMHPTLLPEIWIRSMAIKVRKTSTSVTIYTTWAMHSVLALVVGYRWHVCQAPNAFICVSKIAPPKHQMRLYVCHQMRKYVCYQMRLYVCYQVCHQIRLYVCHQIRLLNPQRNSLRSLTFARFARTFFNSLNWYSCLKSILVWTSIFVWTLILV